MGIVFRQSVKASIVTFTGAVLGLVITYVSARIFSQTEFGFYRDFIAKSLLFSYVMLLGVSETVRIYTQKYAASDPRRKTLLCLALVVPFISVCIISVFYHVFRSDIVSIYKAGDQPYIRMVYYWLPVFTLIWTYICVFEGYLLSQYKVAVSAFLKDVVQRMFLLILIVLFFYGLISFYVFIISLIVTHLFTMLLMLYVSSRTEGFGFNRRWNSFKKKEYRELIHFSWYHMLLMVALVYMLTIDITLLPILSEGGLASTSIYFIATVIISVMIIPHKAMTNATFPVLNEAFIQKDMAKVKDLFIRSGQNIFLVAVAMTLLISTNLDNVLSLLSAEYAQVKPLVLILMVGRLIDMGTGLNSELISISRYYKFNFRLSLFLLVFTVAILFLLIPLYGMYGAAWSITISFAIYNLAKMLFLYKKLRIQPVSKSYVSILLAGTITWVLVFLLPFIYNPVIDAIVRCIAISIIYIPLLLFFKASPDLNMYLKDVVSKKRLF